MAFGDIVTVIGDDGEPLALDSSLWVVTHAGQRGYIHGNSHTFPGRFGVYLPEQDHDLTVDLSDLADMSLEARCWVAGFIAGAEPSLRQYLGIKTFGVRGGPDIEVTPAEHARWLEFRRRFDRDGTCARLNPRPWRPLRLTPVERAAIRLDPFQAWSVAGERVWVPSGDTWVEADPQPPTEPAFRAGTDCDERGHCDIAWVDDGWYVCLDCGEVVDGL